MKPLTKGDLSSTERDALENKVLPKARQWVHDHPAKSALYEHGMQTLTFRGEV